MSERSEQGPPSDGEPDLPPEVVDAQPAGPQDGAPAGPMPAYPPAPPGALPGQPPAYAHQGAPAPPAGSTAPRDKVSVAAFVLSLPGALVISIPLAMWGLVRTSGRARRGRGLAIAALCVSGAWVVVSGLLLLAPGLLGAGQPTVLQEGTSSVAPLVAATPEPTASPSDEPVPAQPTGAMKKAKKVYWEDLRPATCIRTPADAAIDITTVDCRAEHDEEVTARTSLPKTHGWPGDKAVEDAASATCRTAFEKYVGISYDDSRLELSFYSTDKDGWNSGDRTLICTVYDPSAPNLTESLKAAAQ